MSTQAQSSRQGLSATLLPSLNAIGLERFAVSRRVVKIAFAVTLCSAGAFGMLSDSTYISSSNAVVSADVVDVRAPIDGTLSALPLDLGSTVDAGQIVGKVDNPRSDRQHLDNLLTTESSAKAMFEALTAERISLQVQERGLLQRSNVDSTAVASRLKEQSTAAARTLLGLQFSSSEADIEFRRGEQLHDAGIISDAAFERLRSAQLVAREAVAAQQATLSSLRSETADAVRGILTEPGDSSDVAYSRQRADEVAIKLADNEAALDVARGQSEEAHVNVAAETIRENLMRQSEVHAPIRGVVWKRNTADGEDITSGASVLSLVDCNRQFVLVQIPQDRVPDVALHREARVRLAGESEERTGTVASVSGDVLKLENAKLAAVPFQEASQQMATVLITLNPTEKASAMSRAAEKKDGEDGACVLGRAARVLIPTYSTSLAVRWMHEVF